MATGITTRSVAEIAVDDLKEIIREVMREEQRREYVLDDRGYLIFATEQAYADYLAKQEGRRPSEVRARFLDEQGFRCYYSDWEPTTRKVKELERSHREPTVLADIVFDEVRKLGVDI
jgi:hypothetical protein